MNPNGPDLRDIHLPAAPGWWPPAPGWWLLALLVAVGAFFLVRWNLHRLRERRWRRQVLAEFDRLALGAGTLERSRLAAELSQLLRRVARLRDPHAVALHGEAWLDFLDAHLPVTQAATKPFREGVGRALLDAPYRRDDGAAAGYDASALLALARDWIVAALPRGSADV